MTIQSPNDSALEQATVFTGMKLVDLVKFISELEPELTYLEATMLTGVLLENLPRLLREDGRYLNALKSAAKYVMKSRN